MRVIALALLLLGGCGASTVAPDSLASEARSWIEKDFGYREALRFRETWLANGLPQSDIVCGEFEAPAALAEEQLRFVYDRSTKHGQVELHSGTLATAPFAAAIMVQNRRIFDNLWDNNCEKFRPGFFPG